MVNFQLLKFELLSSGLWLTDEAHNRILCDNKVPISARTCLANGLEIVLPHNIWVNAPIVPKYSANISLDFANYNFYLSNNCKYICQIVIPKRPSYYNKLTSNNIDMFKIGTLRGDRLSICLFKDCIYFSKGLQCKFCAIKQNTINEPVTKHINDIYETVSIAVNDVITVPNHIYLNLGTTDHPERGLDEYEIIFKTIRKVTNIPIHLNQSPPQSNSYVKTLYEIGFNEISFNIDIFNEESSAKIMPGKHADIGLSNCLKRLDAAVKYFGIPNVSSCLIIGLEDQKFTLRGIEELMKRGVIPKLSVFRPLCGSAFSNLERPSYNVLKSTWEEAKEYSIKYMIPLGPMCDICKLLSVA
jgi:hypothetical protein